jgi:hypothetical protein
MSVQAHCDCLTRLLFAFEANVHARLGYFPAGLREDCRKHVQDYLESLHNELAQELQSVQQNLVAVKAQKGGTKSDGDRSRDTVGADGGDEDGESEDGEPAAAAREAPTCQ